MPPANDDSGFTMIRPRQHGSSLPHSPDFKVSATSVLTLPCIILVGNDLLDLRDGFSELKLESTTVR